MYAKNADVVSVSRRYVVHSSHMYAKYMTIVFRHAAVECKSAPLRSSRYSQTNIQSIHLCTFMCVVFESIEPSAAHSAYKEIREVILNVGCG